MVEQEGAAKAFYSLSDTIVHATDVLVNNEDSSPYKIASGQTSRRHTECRKLQQDALAQQLFCDGKQDPLIMWDEGTAEGRRALIAR